MNSSALIQSVTLLALLTANVALAGADGPCDPRALAQIYDTGLQEFAKGEKAVARNQPAVARAQFQAAKGLANDVQKQIKACKEGWGPKAAHDTTTYPTKEGTVKLKAFEEKLARLAADAEQKAAASDKPAENAGTGPNAVIGTTLANYYNQAKDSLTAGDKASASNNAAVAKAHYDAAKSMADNCGTMADTYKKTGAWNDKLTFVTLDGTMDAKTFLEKAKKLSADAAAKAAGK